MLKNKIKEFVHLKDSSFLEKSIIIDILRKERYKTRNDFCFPYNFLEFTIFNNFAYMKQQVSQSNKIMKYTKTARDS